MADIALNIVSNISGATEQINSFTAAMRRATSAVSQSGKAANKAGSEISSIASSLSKLGKSTNKAAGAFGKLTRSLGRIAFYRAIRSAIRYVTDSFSQGLSAAYNWSKTQGGEYAKLYKAMDTLSAASGRMKLQLGAAFGGLITAIEPILTRIINLVTAAAEAITRFFAVLNGSGYYKKAASGIDKVGSSAGGASKKIKGLLASWDELNVIGKETGGGGGGSSLDGYLGDYEWVEAESELADLFNSSKFFEIGQKIGDALASAADSFKNFLQSDTVKNFGKNLADAINGFFADNENWFKIGDALGTAFATVVNWITDFFNNFDWKQARDSLKSFAAGLWKGINEAISEETKNAFKFDKPFYKIIWDALFKSGNTDNGNGGGPNQENSVLNWIQENVIDPIFTDIDTWIASLDVKAQELWDAIKDAIFHPKKKQTTGNESPFAGIEEEGIPLDEWISGFSEWWETAKTNIIGIFTGDNPIWDSMMSWVDDINDRFNEWWDSLKTPFERAILSFKLLFADIKKDAIDAWLSILQELNTPTGREVLDYLGIDLTQAILEVAGASVAAGKEIEALEKQYDALAKSGADAAGKTSELNTELDTLSQADVGTIEIGVSGTEEAVEEVTATAAAIAAIAAAKNVKSKVAVTYSGPKTSVLTGVAGAIQGIVNKDATVTVTPPSTESVAAVKDTTTVFKEVAAMKNKTATLTVKRSGEKTANVTKLAAAWETVSDKTGTLTVNAPSNEAVDNIERAKLVFKDLPKAKGSKLTFSTSGASNVIKVGDAFSEIHDKSATANVNYTGTNPEKIVEAGDAIRDLPKGTTTVSVAVKATLDSAKALTESIKKAVGSMKMAVTAGAGGAFYLGFAAEGGLFDSGQLFVAREAGPEMVGTIGSQTAVANNDQIVSGIQAGVAQANSEQNALLRQQNSILAQLLKKDLTISPSVALGQVVARSNQMYARA